MRTFCEAGMENTKLGMAEPKKLEKSLREQGYKGNSYKLLKSDIIEFARMTKEARSTPMPLSHDITSHVLPFEHHILKKYGPCPHVYVMDPELIKRYYQGPTTFKGHTKSRLGTSPLVDV